MGKWSFRGGFIWDGTSFKRNESKMIAVTDRGDREIVLSDNDLIVPGLIDMNVTLWGVDGDKHDCLPTEVLLATGVVACADNGTYGYKRWEQADRIWRYNTAEVKSWFNLIPEYGIVEPKQKTSAKFISVEESVSAYKKAKERSLGFRVTLGCFHKQKDLDWLELARKIADEANCHLMIQLAGATVNVNEILHYVRPGDVLTAVYHSFPGGSIINENGTINEKLVAAVKNGVLLDTGAAEKYFNFKIYEKAAQVGLTPSFISTGMGRRAWREAPVYDMVHMVSKFIAIGMDKNDAFKAAITTPAQYLNIAEPSLENNCLILKAINKKVIYNDNLYGFTTKDLAGTFESDLEYKATLFIRKNKLAFDLR